MSAVGAPADVLVDGRVVGTVTASAPTYRTRLAGEAAPAGSRFAVVEIRYDATGTLSYRAVDWLVVDVNGGRHEIAATQPSRALGQGDLAAGANVSGRIAFQVPAGANVQDIVLRPEGGGRDLVAFRVP